MNFWAQIFGYISAYSMLFVIIMIIPAWLIVGKYFDKQFKKTFNPYANKNQLLPFRPINRAMQYVGMIFFHGGMKKSYGKMVFGDYDFYAHARIIDKIVSYIIAGAFVLGCLFAGLALILTGISKFI